MSPHPPRCSHLSIPKRQSHRVLEKGFARLVWRMESVRGPVIRTASGMWSLSSLPKPSAAQPLRKEAKLTGNLERL
jgi:hypothetical protein